MELTEVIKGRRSIRHFNSQKLSREVIEKILNSALLAPSAMNKQPWHFIVVTNKELKEEIADTLQKKSSEAAITTCNVIRDCQALVLVYGDISSEIFDIESIGASIENMVLESYNQNVGSLWIGFILNIKDELQAKFKIDKTLIAAVALGYTDEVPAPRPRKTLDECTIWYE